jgi:hypothetical protein
MSWSGVNEIGAEMQQQKPKETSGGVPDKAEKLIWYYCQ